MNHVDKEHCTWMIRMPMQDDDTTAGLQILSWPFGQISQKHGIFVDASERQLIVDEQHSNFSGNCSGVAEHLFENYCFP